MCLANSPNQNSPTIFTDEPYFCGNVEIAADLPKHEPQRVALYKATVSLVRAYAAIADDLDAAGYSPAAIARLKHDVKRYLDLREVIRKSSGETIDLKAYEADMRHLIDTYIEADEPRKISPFDGLPLLELIVKTGIAAAIASLPGGLKGNRDAVAETIENNVRSKIIKEHLSDPAYFESMSALLDEIIATRRAKAIDYEEYLKRIAELARRVQAGHGDDAPEQLKRSPGLRALYNNLRRESGVNRAAEPRTQYATAHGDAVLEQALGIDRAVRRVRSDGWRGVQARERIVKAALYEVLQDAAEVERMFLIVVQQPEY